MVAAAVLVPGLAQAASYEIGPGDDVEAAIAMLQPGDELVLAGGMYVMTERFGIDVAGTEAAPIVIRAKDGENPHITRPNADQNLVDIDGADWLEIRGIEWSGGSAGLRMSNVQNLTLADCKIHDTGDVAVRANDTGQLYDNLHIVGNEIYRTNDTGEGMYLGCNNNGCQLANSLIERNWIHDTNQASVVQGDGIEIKEGSYGNVVRDNVIHDTNYPCLLMYSTVGNGPPNIIEGNVMWNCGDNGMQVAADAIIRNNIILGANGSGLAMQPHQSGAPSNLIVVHNTIVMPGGQAISLSGPVGSVVIANNALYSEQGPALQVGGGGEVVVVGNVGLGGYGGGAGYVDGDLSADFVAAMFSGAVPNDVFPADGALVGAGDPMYGVETDFNGSARQDPPDVGAYAYDPDGNPGWTLQAGFKDVPAGGDDGGVDGGSTGGDGPGDGGGSAGDGSAGTSAGDGGGAGDGGVGTSGATSGASEGEGGQNDGGAGGAGDGCGCSSTPRGGGGPLAALGLLVLAAFRRRRATVR